MRFFAHLQPRDKTYAPLLVTLLLASPVVLFQALRYGFPLGYAGMFTLIAEKIAGANFGLPVSIPHYGPGGIPLIYPPFGMYVFALATKLGISTWTYLRVAPAIFTLLALVAFYYFTAEAIGSKVAGVAAVILVITQPAVYYTHVWSAGVVRALALFFCLAGLYFYLRCLRQFSWRRFFLAGIFLGLVFTTHWLYVIFAALVGLAFLIAEWKLSGLPIALGILAVALLLAAPWLILILERHGISNVLMASSSHRNLDFFLSIHKLPQAAQFLAANLRHVTDNVFLTALAIPGFILLIVRKKFHIPLAFLFILFMGEASFYSEILASVMAGALVAEIFHRAPKPAGLKNRNVSHLAGLALIGVVILCFVFSTLGGLKEIIQYQPEINEESLKMASFVRSNTDPSATYLFVGKINEAEWFPYLFDRTPVFAQWGSEWKGEYAKQSEILTALRECELQKNWTCMEAILEEQSVSPSLLVIPNKRWLVRAIRDTNSWDPIYEDGVYLVWKRKNE